MQIPVYDDRYRPRATAGRDEWTRWKSEAAGGWKVVDPLRPAPTAATSRPTTGSTFGIATWSPTRRSGTPWLSDRTPSPAPPADPDHRLLLVQHEPQRRGRELSGSFEAPPRTPGSSPTGSATSPSRPAGGRKGGRRVETRAGQGRRRAPVRDRPGDRQGAAHCAATRRSASSRPRSPSRAATSFEFANVDDRLTLLVDGRSVGRGDRVRPRRRPHRADRGRPVARGRRGPQRGGRGERPCPETRYLLYPDSGKARLRPGLGRSVSPKPRGAVRLPRRSVGLPRHGQRPP